MDESIISETLMDESIHEIHGVTLPDGTVKERKKWETTPVDIAKELLKSLASNALISQVDGVLWDMSMSLEGDCQLNIFTFDINEGCDTFRRFGIRVLKFSGM
ncbi:putative threonine--tRNA ligase [Helianthus annuus]|nr:putative threonine--tRNA ligase [Helianthus annuus]